MSMLDAPLYVQAHDLAIWLSERTVSWPAAHGDLATAVREGACELTCRAALALTFPDRRARHLRRADETIVRLREHLRIAAGLHLLSRRRLRYAAGELAEIGRMIGGWRKRVARHLPPEAVS